MRVVLGVPERAAHSTVLTIGNFDGLHLGHRKMIDRLHECAGQLGHRTAVLTFEPHPREVFAPEQAPPRLTSLREKLALLESCTVDTVHLCRFNSRFAAIEPDRFIQDVLVRGIGVRHLIVGDDFCFGKGRSGNIAMLREQGPRQGFGVETLPTVALDGLRVSSSAVRDALAAGNLDQAARLLGRPYAISGRVVHGDKIGRTLGFPTANVQLKRKRLPLTGVYAVTVSGLDKRHLPGAASIGVRPTIAAGLKPVLEVHLLDFDREIYGSHVTVHFLHKLREEARYETLEALTAQIALDVEQTRQFFSIPAHG